MRISVVMVDGAFRENVFGAGAFSNQDFPQDEYEILWVEHYSNAHPEIADWPKVRTVELGREGVYHSSYCFNAGIEQARGELIVIPDADQIVEPDFLTRVWDAHQRCDKLAAYLYRYDETEQGALDSHELDELRETCVLKNPTNYGGCLTVRRKWLLEINGYEQHPLFGTGNHANGMDIYTRFKNHGLAIQWLNEPRLYHPWHPFTLSHTTEHLAQEKVIQWRRQHVQTMAIEGIDAGRNITPPAGLQQILDRQTKRLAKESGAAPGRKGLLRPLRRFARTVVGR